MENGDFTLTPEQRLQAYEIYKKARNIWKKVIWGSVPPKSEKLNSGKTRVFLTYTEKTRKSKVKEEEGDKEEDEIEILEYEIIYVDVNNPLDKSELIRSLVSQKYQVEDEIAILRQKDEKPEEYEEYNTYVENCKKLVKEWLQK
jgi:hypothetical protein